MRRDRSAVGLLLGLIPGWLLKWLPGLWIGAVVGVGVGVCVGVCADVAVAGPLPARTVSPLAERLPGASAEPADSAAGIRPPALLVTRYGIGFTSRTLIGTDPLPGLHRDIPCLTAWYSRVFFPGVGWAVAIGYGRRSGDPADDPTFVPSTRDRLEIVPVELGLRLCREDPGLLDWGVEIAGLAAWLRETAPPAYQSGLPSESGTRASNVYRHWVAGGRVATGPLVRLPRRRLFLSLTGGFELTTMAEETDGWLAGASSLSWRLVFGRER